MKVADQDPYSSNAYDQSVMQYIRPFYIATQPAHKKVNKGNAITHPHIQKYKSWDGYVYATQKKEI